MCALATDRDLESASSKRINLRPLKTVNYVLCVSVCVFVKVLSALCSCVFVLCSVCVHVLCSCLCGMCTVNVCGVVFEFVWRVHTMCMWCVDGVICSGKENDERNREHVVLNLLSNHEWVNSQTLDG